MPPFVPLSQKTEPSVDAAERALPALAKSLRAVVTSRLPFIRITSYNVCYTKLLRATITNISFTM